LADNTATIVIGIVAPASALAGLIVGKYFDRGAERRRWARDKRYEAYANLVQLAHSVELASGNEDQDALRQGYHQLNDFGHRNALVMSHAVRLKLLELELRCMRSFGGDKEQHVPILILANELINLCRRDLGMPTFRPAWWVGALLKLTPGTKRRLWVLQHFERRNRLDPEIFRPPPPDPSDDDDAEPDPPATATDPIIG
jgi:hypothetical protein